MKSLKLLSLCIAILAAPTVSFGQSKEKFNVSGNCGMCKTKIEKAAKDAGATSAEWDAEKQELKVEFNSSTTNAAKIQKKIAEVGYDNVGFKSTMDAYNKLHGCCKYDRVSSADHKSCCTDKCEMKEGKCKDKNDCKEKGCCTGDNCNASSHGENMDCCKDGKCSKEGHSGTACCKKS